MFESELKMSLSSYEDDDYSSYDDGGSYADSGDSSSSGSSSSNEAGGKYTTVGGVTAVGVGGSVTVTDKGDTLVSIVVGNPGKIITTGTTPSGQDPKDWLSGFGGSVNLPNGAGAATNFDSVQPTVSPPGGAGASVSYTVPLNSNPVPLSDQFKNVIHDAVNYSNHAVGIHQYAR